MHLLHFWILSRCPRRGALERRWRGQPSPLALPFGAGIVLRLLPGATGGSAPPRDRRRPAEMRLLLFQHSTLSNWVTENLKYMRTVRGRERNVFPCSKPRDTILANVAVSISKRLCLRRLSDTPRDLLTPPTWSPLPMCVLVYSQ